MQIARHYGWILVGLLAACSKSDSDDDETGNWVEVQEMSAKPRSEAVSFVIGDTAYIGTGYDGEKYLRDFWKYTPARGWTQITDLPPAAPVRSSATAFVINGIGYVGTGYDNRDRLNDFWAYHPATGAWKPIKPLTHPNPAISLARRDAVSFTLNGKGYVTTGTDGSALKDTWEYDPVKDEWNEKQSFGGSKRHEAVAFVIGGKAYVVTGTNNNELKNDFYSFDGENWEKLKNISNTSDLDYDNDYDIVRTNAVAFVMNNKGYVATGSKSGLSTHCWEYDPVADQWTQRRDFEGTARTGAVAFTFANKGYVLAGRTSSMPLDDMFRFEPDQEYDEND
ncbi:galactose oxidase [Chitinophaga lutea]|uniref:Galactose oxidase n=1 Tax=Chitinophaga lutea TaxID=2488634 RepID=A0A3N4PMU3_9BACT|nr:galactose oxidase [Chitinophaga lutea]RPE09496.1 galactose oxidase [Chitinophaga lutea]